MTKQSLSARLGRLAEELRLNYRYRQEETVREARDAIDEAVKALQLVHGNFKRTNDGNPDHMGDDDFEAWTATDGALNQLTREL